MDSWTLANGTPPRGRAQLTLRSRIAELSLVPAWIEQLSVEHGVAPSTQFAMNLCLEEVLSNIIRHGYRNEEDHAINVCHVSSQNNSLVLAIEDEAPHFNPLTVNAPPVEETTDASRVGGLGLRLLRGFAERVEYEATPTGNRLTLAFSTAG
jgi:anti-sigma regulatory factor (Ser/Thr protein kinase)